MTSGRPPFSAESGDLRLYLQPIVGPDRGVLGYEALVRREGQDRVVELPDAFLSLAEHTGFIMEIGAWVLEEACRLLGEWSQDERTRELFIAVNVSEQQLRSSGFAALVRSALARYGAHAEQLKLEVTETMIHLDLERTTETLRELRADGHRVSLDDFGVGYSSLVHLRRLPVHDVKIDRCFVAHLLEDAFDSAIVEAIVRMAHAVGVTATAEGVESQAQFARLKYLGVELYQGYLFGRPEPAESVRPG